MALIDTAFVTDLLGRRVSVAPRPGWTMQGESDAEPIENGKIRGVGLGVTIWLIIEDQQNRLRVKGFDINTITLLDE